MVGISPSSHSYTPAALRMGALRQAQCRAATGRASMRFQSAENKGVCHERHANHPRRPAPPTTKHPRSLPSPWWRWASLDLAPMALRPACSTRNRLWPIMTCPTPACRWRNSRKRAFSWDLWRFAPAIPWALTAWYYCISGPVWDIRRRQPGNVLSVSSTRITGNSHARRHEFQQTR